MLLIKQLNSMLRNKLRPRKIITSLNHGPISFGKNMNIALKFYIGED